MTTKNLEQIKDEIKQEFIEALKNCKLVDILKNNGIEGHNVLQIQCMLDLTQLKFNDNDTIEDQQFNEFLPTAADESLSSVVQLGICTSGCSPMSNCG